MLSRRDIEKELGKNINIVPFIKNNLKENSINLTIGKNAWTMGGGKLYWNGEESFTLQKGVENKKEWNIVKGANCIVSVNVSKRKKKSYLILFPHTTTIIETSEVLGIGNNIGGALHSKVGVAAKGIGHIGTMLGPGFCGHLMISLHNITDEVITLEVGSTFVSITFDYLDTQVIRTSATISGHVDKFADLGIKINESTRNYLTEDWKNDIESIRDKMSESEAFKEYRVYLRKNFYKEIKKYVTKRNILAVAVVVAIFIGIWFLAYRMDMRLDKPVWVERFWNVGCSGMVGTLLMALYSFIKEKR